MAFAIQRVLPTSPIYRGPNPMHIEVQICAHKGSKALHTSQRTCAFILGSELGGSNWTFRLSAQAPSSNWICWLSAQDISGSDARSIKQLDIPTIRTRAHKQLEMPEIRTSAPNSQTKGICETGRWHASSFPLHPKGQDFNQFASGLDLKRCQ